MRSVGRRTLVAAVAGLVLALPGVARGQQELPQPRMDDAGISDAIREEFAFDPAVPDYAVTVTTLDGVVTLEGVTNDILARERAERLAEIVRGVRSVVNEIDVDPAVTRTDDEIRAEVTDALVIHPATEAFQVHVVVQDGRVTLTGTVDAWREKKLAGTMAKGVSGVREVENRIAVDYRTMRADDEIEADVEAALRWDALVDDGLVSVDVTGGIVRLSGVVGSAAEKRRARQDAWVGGVLAVEDTNLTVARWARDPELRRHVPADLTDADVEDAVETALLYDPRVLSTAVDVGVEGFTVTLSGTVESLDAYRAAAADARNTTGVRVVENQLRVEPKVPLADAEIEQRVERRLLRDPYLAGADIDVTVDDGTVTLTGGTETTFQRARADDLAGEIMGVREVMNLLVASDLLPPLVYNPFLDDWYPEDFAWYVPDATTAPLADTALQDAIERNLFWSPFVDAPEVDVVVSDGVATLTGTVDTWLEKVHATLNAYEGGAVDVRNLLVVLE